MVSICLLSIGSVINLVDGVSSFTDRFTNDKFFDMPDQALKAQKLIKAGQEEQLKYADNVGGLADKFEKGEKVGKKVQTQILDAKEKEEKVVKKVQTQTVDAKDMNKIHKDLDDGGHMDYSKKVDDQGRTHSNWDVKVKS